MLPAYAIEPYADFALPANRQRQQEAVDAVRAELGRDYNNWIAGRAVQTGQWLASVNPAQPSEIIGRHSKADAVQARQALNSNLRARRMAAVLTRISTRCSTGVKAHSLK